MEFGKEEDKSKGKLFQKKPLLWVFESDSRLNKFYWDKQGRIIKMVAKRNDMQEIEDVTYYFQYEMY